MHATYCFLSNSDSPLEELECLIGSGEYDFDENNWYQPMCIVNSRGEVTQLSGKEDWRGRNKFANMFKYAKKDIRWQKAINFAMSCFMCDIIDAITAGDYESRGYVERTTTFINAEKKIRDTLSGKSHRLSTYHISALSKALDNLTYSKNGFSYNFYNPYDGPRAVMMNDADLFKENASIIFVDVHT